MTPDQYLDVITEAVDAMRDRASEAEPGPWVARHGRVVCHVHERIVGVMVEADGEDDRRANAVHAASWHPMVALAVAAWLDDILTRARAGSDLAWPHPRDVEHAAQVSRLFLNYLGRAGL